jgi:NB-ARC domain-containing protein
LFDGLLPKGGSGHIILTSRSPRVPEDSYSGSNLHVLPFDNAESRELFCRITGSLRVDASKELIHNLVDKFQGLPLAINHIACYIKRTKSTVEGFAMKYEASAADVLQIVNQNDGYPHSMATAFAIGRLDVSSRRLLRVLCYLDPDQVPKGFIRSYFSQDAGFEPVSTVLQYVSPHVRLLLISYGALLVAKSRLGPRTISPDLARVVSSQWLVKA